MIESIFSNASHVQIQGDEVLRIVEEKEDIARYRLIGFEHYPVVIEDRRPVGLAALADYRRDGLPYAFAPKFNHPAHVTITSGPGNQILVKLLETENKNPDYMLWIAIGMQEEPPDYSFVFFENISYQKNKTALFSLYKRPKVARIRSSHPEDFSHRQIDTAIAQNLDCAVLIR
jgi:hypothetical protein